MSKNKVAIFGEEIVSLWLQNQGWSILHSRWAGRKGEIDLIAKQGNSLAFVEVKTRFEHNLDFNGLLAITKTKQAKIIQTAQLFLSVYPNLSRLNCRFDVALVTYNYLQDFGESQKVKSTEVCCSKGNSWKVVKDQYEFILKEYIEGAFET